MPRVTYITHYSELYGANRSMLDLILEARTRGVVEPLVILPREGPLVEELKREEIAHAMIPFEPWMSDRVYMGGPHHRLMQHLRYELAARERRSVNARAIPVVLKAIADHGSQLVHLNSAAVGIAGGLLRQVHRPVIWHIRELPERQYLLNIDAGRRRYGQSLRRAARLIAISDAVKMDIQRYAGERVAVTRIHNGVLPQARYAELRSQAGGRWSHPSPFTFLLLGLIHPSKGQEEAIRAMDIVRRSHPEVRLLIAGSGKDQHLHKLVAALGVEQFVDIRGFIPDPWPLYVRSHALLMCSRNEAFGRVTIEAMGSGLPVIGHASGGTIELVQDGVNGLLYPGGEVQLADRMVRVVGDPSFARSLGDRAMALAAERFSVERMTDEVLAVYEQVIPRH